MKIEIEWCLQTHGDFMLEHAGRYDVFGNDLSGRQTFVSDNCDDSVRIQKAVSDAIQFLCELLCDIRVTPTHYYLYKDLYRLFNNIIAFIRDYKLVDGDVVFTETIEGDYEGTQIKVRIYENLPAILRKKTVDNSKSVCTPEEFAKQMREIACMTNMEDRHMAMDTLMVDTLLDLGYVEGVSIYTQTEKWFA